MVEECYCDINAYSLKGMCECEEDCTCGCEICDCEPHDWRLNPIIDLWDADIPATSACSCEGNCSCEKSSHETT